MRMGQNTGERDEQTGGRRHGAGRPLRILAAAAVLAGTALLLWHAFGRMIPDLIPLLQKGDSADIVAYLEEEGQWTGMLCVFLLAFLQVVSIFLPGMPIQIAGGAIYGWLKGFIICFLGYWSANMAVFGFARKVNNRMSDKMPAGSRAAWLKEKLDSSQPGFIVMLACLVPAVPNGIIPYIAARSRIRFVQFAEAVAAGCAMPIFFTCLTGRFFLEGNYGYGIAAVAFQFLIIGLIVWKRDWFLEHLG